MIFGALIAQEAEQLTDNLQIACTCRRPPSAPDKRLPRAALVPASNDQSVHGRQRQSGS